jgi:hypothetical protein
MDEFYYNSPENSIEIQKELNFYCQYYDQIQPHIIAYIESKNINEQRDANKKFWSYRSSVEDSVKSQPHLYQLEVAKEEKQWSEIYNPIIAWLIMGGFSFLLLQVIRICYVYVVYGKLVWHPFRKIEE